MSGSIPSSFASFILSATEALRATAPSLVTAEDEPSVGSAFKASSINSAASSEFAGLEMRLFSAVLSSTPAFFTFCILSLVIGAFSAFSKVSFNKSDDLTPNFSCSSITFTVSSRLPTKSDIKASEPLEPSTEFLLPPFSSEACFSESISEAPTVAST